jgi:protein-disulfide isomerase
MGMTRFVALICAVCAIALGGFIASAPANPFVGAANAQDAADVDTSSIIEMTQGAEDAPVTIIEYASFTCPHCADFHKGPFKEIKANYIDTGKVRFIYREVYFDRYGLWASMIARCAGPDKFFGITELIYDGQSEWARAGGPTEIVDELRKIGRLAGIENDALEACLQDGTKAQTLVAWFQKNAEADQIDSTPSFIVNGKKVSNQSYADFAALIDAELGS